LQWEEAIVPAAKFKHILLFEHRSGMRQLMYEVLEELGYRVSLAVDATGARFALANGDFDLLIANIAHVGGDEHHVAEYAASVGLPCVLMSHVQEVRRSFGKETATFVDKPFTLKQFGNQVAKVLSTHQVRSVAH
jgi:DNA-binding NtrC family response regulator